MTATTTTISRSAAALLTAAHLLACQLDRPGVTLDSVDASPPPDASPTIEHDAAPGGCTADLDGDGVCDTDDLCPGSDDRIDQDGDQIPDGCDPCSVDGPLAVTIALPVAGSGITIYQADLNGANNAAIVTPGEFISLDLSFAIDDCGCPGCRDQIELGFSDSAEYQICAYDDVPGCQGDAGGGSGLLQAPSTSGEYHIRFGLRQDFGCTSAIWQRGEPPPSQSVATVCVVAALGE